MDSKLNPQSIAQQATKEIEEHEFRIQVEVEKARMRKKARMSFWSKLFPWRLKRVDKVDHYEEFCKNLAALRKDGLIVKVKIAGSMGGLQFFMDY